MEIQKLQRSTDITFGKQMFSRDAAHTEDTTVRNIRKQITFNS